MTRLDKRQKFPPPHTQKMTEIILSQNSDLFQNLNDVQLPKESDPEDKNSVKNNVKEKYEKNVINLKISTPLKDHMEFKNKLNKTILSNKAEIVEKQTIDKVDKSIVCGLEFFRASWFQPYATVKVYLFFYSIIGILHGSYFSYLAGTISTLEKRFAFKSKISGVIFFMDEIIPLLLGTIAGYYATKAHQPRLVALGMMFSAMCCFVASLPYFIYGPVQNLLFNDTISDTGPEQCELNLKRVPCDQGRPQNLNSVICLMFGTFLKGFGSLAYYAIGLSYLDDNSDKQSTPIYLGK